MGNSTGYSVAGYGEMINSRERMGPYVAVLRQAIRPGCTVLDIGSGTGIFSILACRMGAGKVHAIEPDNAIEVARESAVANGLSDRIEFHQAMSNAVNLPVMADVVVSDLRGVLPLFQQHIPTIIDARRRLLAPDGVLVPRRDHLWAALVEMPEHHIAEQPSWLVDDYDIDLSAGNSLVVNRWKRVRARSEQLLTKPYRWATLDYATIEQPNVSAEIAWKTERPGTAHGLLLWFDTELGDGIGFSNAPGQPEQIYGQAFFPLQSPVVLEPDDRIETQIFANLVDGEYVWRWHTRVDDGQGGESLKANFRQSSILAVPLSLETLKRREGGYVPRLNDKAELDRVCLSLLDGTKSLESVARELNVQFSPRFPRFKDALTYVADLVERYRESAT